MKVGIIAALSGELKPLIRGWQRRGPLYFGRIGDAECIAIAGGMGAEAATRACELILAEDKLDALASIGWAGSLSCGLKPRTACAIYEVFDAVTGERFVTDFPAGQTLVTLDHVARHDEKHDLAQKYQAPLVDMEAAAIARIAAARNLAFYCFKGISDGANDKLPDFNRFIGENGQLRMPRFITYALLHPQYWPALRQLDRQSRGAAESLATIVTESLRHPL